MKNVSFSVDEQNVSTKEIGFNLANFEELRKNVKAQVNNTIMRYHPNHFLPVEDIAWDCFTSLYLKGFFHKFDMSKAQKTTYLYSGVKNYLIDRERGVNTRLKTVSLDAQISPRCTLSLADVIDDNVSSEAVGIEAYLEVLELIKPHKQTGTSKIIGKTAELGDIELSGYAVLYLSLVGYKIHEIAKMFKVTGPYISNFYTSGINELKATVQDCDFDGNLMDCFSVLRKKMQKEDTLVCPHCGSKKTRFWSDDSWSGVAFHVCKDCNRAFSEFTGTPIAKMRNTERKKYFDFMLGYLKGITLGEALKAAGVKREKALKWLEDFKSYFAGEPRWMVEQKILRWSKVVQLAEANKEYRANESFKNRQHEGRNVYAA